MSSLFYPTNLPGLKLENERTPIFRTGVQSALSFKESRIAYSLFPVMEFVLQYEFLRDRAAPSDLKAIVGLYGAHRGRFDSFLFTDPTFNTVALEQFATGDGFTTQFQLTAGYKNSGGPVMTELVQHLSTTPNLYTNGILQTLTTHYTLSGTGIVTYVTPPTAGHPLTWSGSFYYRCRFDEDRLTTTQFMQRLWSTRQVRLRSIKL